MLRRKQSSKDIKLRVFQVERTAGIEAPSQEIFWNVLETECTRKRETEEKARDVGGEGFQYRSSV